MSEITGESEKKEALEDVEGLEGDVEALNNMLELAKTIPSKMLDKILGSIFKIQK